MEKATNSVSEDNKREPITSFMPGVLRKPTVHIPLILILGLIVYSNTFNAPFHLDDDRTIVDNPVTKDFGNFFGLSKTGAGEAFGIYKSGRYIGFLTFALNYKLHGIDVTGYHVFNLLVHIINGLLVYLLVNLTFRTDRMLPSVPDGPRTGTLLALFAALLFVAHPVQTQAVTYIVQRFASLATMLYLLSLVLYIKARTGRVKDGAGSRVFTNLSIPFYLLSIISAVLAMKTKEIAFTLPMLIILYEFLFFEGEVKKRILYTAPLLLTMLIIPLSLVGMDKPLGELIGDVSEATRVHTALSRTDYLFTQFRVIVTYVRLLLFPVNQNLDYDYPVFHSFFDVQVLLSFLCLASLLGLGVYPLYRFRRAAATSGPLRPDVLLIAFGIFWFFITLSTESSLIPITDVMFEHRVYLPSVGVFIGITALISYGADGLKKHLHQGETTVIAGCALLVIAFSGAAFVRNTVWRSKLSLWEDVVQKSPDKARPHNNLGLAYYNSGRIERAAEQYLTAIGITPAYSMAHNNLGIVYYDKGLIEKAIAHFLVSLKVNPTYALAHNNLGYAYMSKKEFERAILHFRKAVKINPYFTRAYNNLGFAYYSIGNYDEATRTYRTAVKLSSRYGKTPKKRDLTKRNMERRPAWADRP